MQTESSMGVVWRNSKTPTRHALRAIGNISCRHKTNCILSFVFEKSARVILLMIAIFARVE